MRGIRVGSAFGIPVKLNWTFLIIIPLFAAFIAWDVVTIVEVLNEFGAGLDADRLDSGWMPWIVGFASAFGLFLGVLLHEFGHSLVAMRYGYEIDSITLWLLGGLAQFTEFPENWRHEFWIAIAGPVVSVLFGVASYVAYVSVPGGFDAVRFVLAYLAILNVALAAFNMLPGFPMDGGRVLRALLARNQPHHRATQQAAEIGKVFAVLLGIFGLFANWFLILLALFIYIAASGEAQQSTIKAAFEGVSVSDVMTPRADLQTVSADTTIQALLDRMFVERHVGYPVVQDGALVGVITLDDSASIDPGERDRYRVDEVMTTDVETIDVDASAMDAFERMQRNDVGRLPVVDERGELVGLISRTDLMRALDVIKTSGTPRMIGPTDAEAPFRP